MGSTQDENSVGRKNSRQRPKDCDSKADHATAKEHSTVQQQVINQLREQIRAIDLHSKNHVTPFSGPNVSLGESTGQQTSYWLDHSSADPFPEVQQEPEEVEELDFFQLEDSFDLSAEDKNSLIGDGHHPAVESKSAEESDLVEMDSRKKAGQGALTFSQSKARIISTGNAVWDGWFPDGGISSGSVLSWVSPPAGSGSIHLIFDVARKICGPDGLFVVIDPKKQIYPGALLASGFDFQKVLFIHPEDNAEQLWALEQCLSDSSVSAVWTSSDETDGRYQRRWQLAARKGDTVGLLSRSLQVVDLPVWCDAQFLVKPLAESESVSTFSSRFSKQKKSRSIAGNEDWTLEVQALKCRGLFGQPKVQIVLKNEVLEGFSGERDQKVFDVNHRSFGN